jgi:Domain of unknown function (DUF1707)
VTQPDDALRVSDAERDAVLRTLGDHAAVGRLTLDELDLREAEIEGGGLTLNLFALMGGSNIYVPDSVEVEIGGFSIMGGHEQIGNERTPRPGAPVIRIRVYTLMGGASIYRLPPQARGVNLKDARRLAKSAERGELPAPD